LAEHLVDTLRLHPVRKTKHRCLTIADTHTPTIGDITVTNLKTGANNPSLPRTYDHLYPLS